MRMSAPLGAVSPDGEKSGDGGANRHPPNPYW